MSKKCTPLWREAHFEVKMYKAHQVRTTFGSCDVEKCTPLWREAHFQVKMYKAHHCRTTFGSCDVEKVHAVVARSTFPSQNVQNTSGTDHFWKLSCGKSARRCGAKHIFQVKMYKSPHVCATFGGSDVEKVHVVVARSTFPSQNVQITTCLRHFLEVRMLKKCTSLWREAHFEVKIYKTPHVGATFGGSDVEKVHVVVAQSTFPSQNGQSTTCSRHFWKFGC